MRIVVLLSASCLCICLVLLWCTFGVLVSWLHHSRNRLLLWLSFYLLGIWVVMGSLYRLLRSILFYLGLIGGISFFVGVFVLRDICSSCFFHPMSCPLFHNLFSCSFSGCWFFAVYLYLVMPILCLIKIRLCITL